MSPLKLAVVVICVLVSLIGIARLFGWRLVGIASENEVSRDWREGR